MNNAKFDTSKIDRLELRAEIAALDEKRKVLVANCTAADEQEGSARRARLEAYRRHRDERDALWQKYETEQDLLAEQHASEIDALPEDEDVEADAALKAHDEATAYVLASEFDDDGYAARCCVTGLVLLDGDELVTDSEDRSALAAALAWPEFSPVAGDSLSPVAGDFADAEPAASDATSQSEAAQ